MSGKTEETGFKYQNKYFAVGGRKVTCYSADLSLSFIVRVNSETGDEL